VRAKPDLIPDCDVHGEPMVQDECPASLLGLEGSRDLLIWRCTRSGCGRYFHGTVGYRDAGSSAVVNTGAPKCAREGAFLVVQGALGVRICPVAGCHTVQKIQAPATAKWHAREAESRAAVAARD